MIKTWFSSACIARDSLYNSKDQWSNYFTIIKYKLSNVSVDSVIRIRR